MTQEGSKPLQMSLSARTSFLGATGSIAAGSRAAHIRMEFALSAPTHPAGLEPRPAAGRSTSSHARPRATWAGLARHSPRREPKALYQLSYLEMEVQLLQSARRAPAHPSANGSRPGLRAWPRVRVQLCRERHADKASHSQRQEGVGRSHEAKLPGDAGESSVGSPVQGGLYRTDPDRRCRAAWSRDGSIETHPERACIMMPLVVT